MLYSSNGEIFNRSINIVWETIIVIQRLRVSPFVIISCKQKLEKKGAGSFAVGVLSLAP